MILTRKFSPLLPPRSCFSSFARQTSSHPSCRCYCCYYWCQPDASTGASTESALLNCACMCIWPSGDCQPLPLSCYPINDPSERNRRVANACKASSMQANELKAKPGGGEPPSQGAQRYDGPLPAPTCPCGPLLELMESTCLSVCLSDRLLACEQCPIVCDMERAKSLASIP